MLSCRAVRGGAVVLLPDYGTLMGYAEKTQKRQPAQTTQNIRAISLAGRRNVPPDPKDLRGGVPGI
jgi:hypothetical protein